MKVSNDPIRSSGETIFVSKKKKVRLLILISLTVPPTLMLEITKIIKV